MPKKMPQLQSLDNFCPIKNSTFWVKICSKNAQDEVRPHFHVHNCVQNLILIILVKKSKKNV